MQVNSIETEVKSETPADIERSFYKFETCAVQTYYVESPEKEGLSEALARLKRHFKIDPNRYCKGCDAASISRISIVPENQLPQADDPLRFVSFGDGRRTSSYRPSMQCK